MAAVDEDQDKFIITSLGELGQGQVKVSGMSHPWRAPWLGQILYMPVQLWELQSGGDKEQTSHCLLMGTR